MDGYEPVDNDIGDPNLPWMWHLPSLALLRFAYGSRTRMFITVMSIIVVFNLTMDRISMHMRGIPLDGMPETTNPKDEGAESADEQVVLRWNSQIMFPGGVSDRDGDSMYVVAAYVQWMDGTVHVAGVQGDGYRLECSWKTEDGNLLTATDGVDRDIMGIDRLSASCITDSWNATVTAVCKVTHNGIFVGHVAAPVATVPIGVVAPNVQFNGLNSRQRCSDSYSNNTSKGMVTDWNNLPPTVGFVTGLDCGGYTLKVIRNQAGMVTAMSTVRVGDAISYMSFASGSVHSVYYDRENVNSLSSSILMGNRLLYGDDGALSHMELGTCPNASSLLQTIVSQRRRWTTTQHVLLSRSDTPWIDGEAKVSLILNSYAPVMSMDIGQDVIVSDRICMAWSGTLSLTVAAKVYIHDAHNRTVLTASLAGDRSDTVAWPFVTPFGVAFPGEVTSRATVTFETAATAPAAVLIGRDVSLALDIQGCWSQNNKGRSNGSEGKIELTNVRADVLTSNTHRRVSTVRADACGVWSSVTVSVETSVRTTGNVRVTTSTASSVEYSFVGAAAAPFNATAAHDNIDGGEVSGGSDETLWWKALGYGDVSDARTEDCLAKATNSDGEVDVDTQAVEGVAVMDFITMTASDGSQSDARNGLSQKKTDFIACGEATETCAIT